MGTREVLGEEDEVSTSAYSPTYIRSSSYIFECQVQPNGKMFTKLDLGDYRWLSYDEVDSMAERFGRGLRALGQESGESVCLFADTRMEWMVAAQVKLFNIINMIMLVVHCPKSIVQASFRQSFPVVTLYTNLGEEAVIHGLNETGAELVITSHELLPKFRTILAANKDKVKTIVYMESPLHRTPTLGFRDDVTIVSFWEVAGERLPHFISSKNFQSVAGDQSRQAGLG